MVMLVVAAGTVLTGCGVAGAGRQTAASDAQESAADRAVWALLDEDDEALLRRDPLAASRRGDRRFDGLLPDVSPEGAFVLESRERLERLRAIDRAGLSAPRRTDADLLERELVDRIEGERFALWQTPVNQVDGPQQELPQTPDTVSVTNAEQRRAYLARLRATPAYLEQTIANMRAGLAAGRTPARVVMGKVHEQALAHGTAAIGGDATRHVMFRPFAGLAAEDPMRVEAAGVIVREVAPAFQRLGEFLRDEYTPRCRESVACADLPDGAAQYRFMLRRMTTTGRSAEEIHALGLSEVARIKGEMLTAIGRSDFPGKAAASGDALLSSFLAYLRGNPRFTASSAEDLLDRYRAFAKRVDAELPKLFGTLPRLPYGVRAMPEFIAPTSPTAYYFQGSMATGVAGYFVANTHNLAERPTYEIMPLTLHEASPGHHLQTAIAREASGVHRWRRERWYTSYGEGWALYAERLGLEMSPRPGAKHTDRGIFDDPYDDFGRLTYEMWRAMRLVVDTGIHTMGWSRDRAIAYMLANSGLSRENVEREVDRYIAWPGQATAYKIGEIEIRGLRARAERALGGGFDVRAFHDMLLSEGSVPLDVLSEMTDRWIAARSAQVGR